MSDFRWGICSAGKISQDFSKAVITLEKHKIQAVAARSKNDAQRLADQFGAEVAYEGYESLAADPNVDIVYVGSINTQHFPLCKLYLEAKKHVLCEKPLGMNAKEVATLIDMARESGCFFMEGLWSRFFPAYEKIRSLIAAGEIGEVKFITADFCYDASNVGRVNDKAIGGGAIYDLGVYLVQLATMVLGPAPESVQGTGGLNQAGVDEICNIILRYPGNKMASMMTSISAFSNNQASIVGSKGRICMSDCFHVATRLELIRGFPFPGLFQKEVFEFPLPETDQTFNFTNSLGLLYEAEAVRKAVVEGKTEHPLVPWSDSLAICKIMDKLRHDVGYYTNGEERGDSD